MGRGAFITHHLKRSIDVVEYARARDRQNSIFREKIRLSQRPRYIARK